MEAEFGRVVLGKWCGDREGASAFAGDELVIVDSPEQR
jgi:hypothetical protein